MIFHFTNIIIFKNNAKFKKKGKLIMKRILIILMYKQHTRSSSCRLFTKGRQFWLKNGVIFIMLWFPPIITGCWNQQDFDDY